jgi:RimJ/RimL family protein N-acetyltransferase
MSIRQATRSDAVELASLFEAVYAESKYMLMEPGESVADAQALADRIDNGARCQTEIWFVSGTGEGLDGFLYGRRGIARRNRHSLYLVMGVRKAVWGQGIGAALLASIDHWASGAAIHRLELTVISSNERAIRAYTRAGFVSEGTKRHSLLIDGSCVDEIYMSKLRSP